MNTRILIFAIYTILYEAIVWGVFGYAVFIAGHSGWWVLLAVLISAGQLKPKHFGVYYEVDDGK